LSQAKKIEWSQETVLVTGAAGFIGSNLVDELVRRGSQVIALDDCSVGNPKNLDEARASGRVEFVQGSILDRDLMAKLAARSSVVLHLAVACLRVCFDKPTHVHDVNATGTLCLLEECQKHCPDLKRFVYCSSSEIYGTALTAPMDEQHPLNPTTVYGASKLAGELYTQAFVRTYNMPALIVRPFNTYGYREHHEGASGEVIPRFLVRLRNQLSPVIFGDGLQTRDFTFVTDTVKGLLAAAECDALIGDAINIARGEEVSIRKIAELLLELTGNSQMEVQYEDARPADVMRHYADVTKAEKILGYKATLGIREGLKLYIDWFSKVHGDPSQLLAEVHDQNWVLPGV
jgi:UDP-glucose 4-epimerase